MKRIHPISNGEDDLQKTIDEIDSNKQRDSAESRKKSVWPKRSYDKYLLSPVRNTSRDLEKNASRILSVDQERWIATDVDTIGVNDDRVRSKSENETFEQILSCKSCVQLLLNYLNENPSTSSDIELLRKFESLTREFLVRFSVQAQSRLSFLLRENGWEGSKYNNSMDSSTLYASLLSLYSNYNIEISKYNISNKGNLIKSFCPTLLLEDLMDISSKKESLSAWKHDFDGVCMLADISGFTKLAAAYSAEGAAGLDKLHETTTFFLGQFVEQVYSYEGDGIDSNHVYFPV